MPSAPFSTRRVGVRCRSLNQRTTNVAPTQYAEPIGRTLSLAYTRANALFRNSIELGLVIFQRGEVGRSGGELDAVAVVASWRFCASGKRYIPRDVNLFLHPPDPRDRPLEGTDGMKRKQFSQEQIIGLLKKAEAGAVVTELCRKHGMSSATYSA